MQAGEKDAAASFDDEDDSTPKVVHHTTPVLDVLGVDSYLVRTNGGPPTLAMAPLLADNH